jgi:hypothetical protein
MPGRYVVEQVGAIPAEDIEESYAVGYPTVLIIGPSNFTGPIAEQLEGEGYQVSRRRHPPGPRIDVLAGYRILMSEQYSRLGWRIVLECDTPPNIREILRRAIGENLELRDLLDEEYVARHLGIVQLLTRLVNSEELSAEEPEAVLDATGRSLEALRVELGLDVDHPIEIDKTKASSTL